MTRQKFHFSNVLEGLFIIGFGHTHIDGWEFIGPGNGFFKDKTVESGADTPEADGR
jgi:hypothetical protein